MSNINLSRYFTCFSKKPSYSETITKHIRTFFLPFMMFSLIANADDTVSSGKRTPMYIINMSKDTIAIVLTSEKLVYRSSCTVIPYNKGNKLMGFFYPAAFTVYEFSSDECNFHDGIKQEHFRIQPPSAVKSQVILTGRKPKIQYGD
ncbi:hypothetical protein [Dickeya dianthicola]|uniref:hypothetical protein n=1 Tax=Dickeya dianthicola TaxID=204039 RepID=UPI001867E210|nr:hypothetical protein [Dickeya dianthicola]QOL14710.1 hypothetical protein HGI48_11110 [Dickeya dianthicola]